jgi:hypothetical protein
MGGNIASINVDTPVTWAKTAISTEIDSELVALDVTKGVCYGLNRIGTRIWQLIETPRSAREIADILLSEFDVPPEVCLEQTLNLLRELAAAELVRE